MEELDQISELLERVRSRLETQDPEERALRNLDALEFPDLVAAVVDHLQPALEPYELAIYWRLFRDSVLRHGTQYVRASTRGLRAGVITSRSGQSSDLSYASVQKALQGLEEKGAILTAGDTTREGTLYQVRLPEEIPVARESMANAQVGAADPQPVDEAQELDFYNVAENRLKIFERDGYLCNYCEKQLTRFTATLDHIQPVSEGGDNSRDNLITACLHCNSRRGSKPVMEAILRPRRSDA